MKSKVRFFLGALVIGAYCCTPKGDSTVSEVIVNGNVVYVATLNELKSDTVTIALGGLVEYCNLVQLETREDAYVVPLTPTITDKYIGIRQHVREPYKLFDRSGKFLHSIGSFGGGPGEYQMPIWDDVIDDKNELIYLMTYMGDKILVYNTSGKFLKEIVAPHRIVMPSMFLSDNILTVTHMSTGEQSIAIQFDVNTGEALKKLAPPASLTIQRLSSYAIFSTRNVPGVLDLYNTVSDTLYHVDLKNNKILPFFTTVFSSNENIGKLYFPLNKDFIITGLRHCSREKNECKTMIAATDLKHKKSSFIRMVNDYYGNLPVPITVENSFRNGYFAFSIQPEDLMEDIKNRLAESGVSASDRDVLTKTLSTLKEGANNVVFIGKLKNEVKTKLW